MPDYVDIYPPPAGGRRLLLRPGWGRRRGRHVALAGAGSRVTIGASSPQSVDTAGRPQQQP